MVKSHAVRDATATVMPSDSEARKSKSLHDDYQVACHGALRVGCMIRGGDRAPTAPIAT